MILDNEVKPPNLVEILRNTTPVEPAEAVKTIDRAEKYDMHPDDYHEMKDTLNPDADIDERVPASVDPSVIKYASKSMTHANSIAKEIPLIDQIAKQAKYVWYNLTEKQTLEKEIQNLNNKDRTSNEGLNDDDKDYLNYLYSQQEEKQKEFGIEGYAQIPGQVAGTFNDMFQAVKSHKAIVATGVAGGAALGAAGGLGIASAATASAGAISGLGLGVVTAMAINTYQRTADATYGDLGRMSDDNGEPLNLPKDTKENLSMGLGIVSGAGEFLAGKFIEGGLSKIATNKMILDKIVKNTSLRAATDVLGHTIKSAIASSGEEVVTEVATLFEEQYAKDIKNEETLTNTLLKFSSDMINNPETRQRLGLTAAVGAAAGGFIAGGGGVLTAKKRIKVYDEANIELIKQNKKNEIVFNMKKAVDHQGSMVELAGMLDSTELKKLSPKQASEFVKDVFQDAGYNDKIWFNETDLQTIETANPDLGAKIRNLDVTEATKSKSGAPVALDPHEFLPLISESPTVSEYARLNPEAPNPMESKNFFKRLEDANNERRKILESLGPEEKLSPEQVDQLKSIDKITEEGFQTSGENDYFYKPIFTANVENALNPKVVEDYNNAQLQARMEHIDYVNKLFDEQEKRETNLEVKEYEDLEKLFQQEQNRKNVEVVNKFQVKTDKQLPKREIPGHKYKNFSEYAIDPKFLPDDLREAYLKDEKLNARKVFVEGGMSPDESAALLGISNGESLLKILANTPTKEEMRTEIKIKSSKAKEMIQKERDLKKSERANKFFDEQTKRHVKDMEFMRTQKWPETKKGIKAIMLPLPKIEEIQDTAKKIVAQTKVSQLKGKQFVSGEKTFDRKAANHILKNEPIEASAAKEKAILNNELAREAFNVKDRIDDAKIFIKKATSKSGMQLFKDAKMTKEVNQIVALFNLNEVGSNKVQQGYFDYLASLKDKGENIIIPESLSDIRQRGGELTTEQYLRVSERLQTLQKQAKLKNKLLKKSEELDKLGKIQTVESVVTELVTDLQSHPNFSEKVFKETVHQNSVTALSKLNNFIFRSVPTLITNYKNVINEADEYKLSGKNQKYIAQPMIKSETWKRDRLSQIVNQIKKIGDDYGKKDFENAFNDFIEIKEFKGYAELGNGTMARSDLWKLLMYQGDPHARERIQNYKHSTNQTPMTLDIVKKVLDTHLTEQDAKLAQNFVNIFKTFEQEASDLHERTTGVRPNMVKGVSFEHKGKVYEGGYVPLDYLNTSFVERTNRFLEGMGDKNSIFGKEGDGKLYSTLRAMEQTEQGRLIDRTTNSSRPLDLDFKGILQAFEEHTHDVAYRETGMDVLNILRNEPYAKALVATVGKEKYDLMVDAVVETVGKSHLEDSIGPFSQQKRMVDQIYRYIENGVSIKALGFKLSSVLMQPLSVGGSILRMGPKSSKYVLKTVGHVLTNLNKYGEIFAKAGEINPDLLTGRDSIDDSLIRSTYNFIPETKRSGLDKTLDYLNDGKKLFQETAMWGLKTFDTHIKAIVSLAASGHFLDGNVEGFSTEQLNKMTPKQVDTEMKRYVKQIADLSLTTSADIDKSAIEKVAMMRMFTRFYTDLRSQLNTANAQVGKVVLSAKRAKEDFVSGDIGKGVSHLKKGSIEASSMVMIYALSQVYQDLVRGEEENPITDLGNVNDWESLKNYMGNTASYVALSPAASYLSSVPVARDVQFAAGGKFTRKEVRPSTFVFLGDIATSATGLADLWEGKSLKKDQVKALKSLGGTLGAFPVNGPTEVVKAIDESEIFGNVSDFIGRQFVRLNDNIDKAIKNNPDDQALIEEGKHIQETVIPPQYRPPKELVPENALEDMKIAKWDEVDPKTGASGIYQFTEERWNQIIDENPNLALTENGRVSKDPKEQEKAMKYELEKISSTFASYNIPINKENILGAHLFGVNDYSAILLSEDTDKLEAVVEDKENFANFKTIKEVKSYVKRKLTKK